jgi:pimeloyl-ACP methyl ester carboxylesterase
VKSACLVVLVTGVVAVPGALLAQPSPPTHKHYDTPAGYEQPQPGKPLAPRLQNLGVHTFPVSTKHSRAQLFMNQGLNLVYGFNHAEATRAFAEAARLDPNLAMAYWGQALVLGPNINAPMDPQNETKALELVQKAVTLKARATLRERAYIDALATRYTGRADDRKNADRAFADAMQKLVAKYPDDLDARTLYAEALMDTRPWNYWTRDGLPYDETRQVEAALTHVLSKHKNHPGALHLWVHLWEATDTPERAEAEADRLLPLMPGAGHIVHMPAHIYQRVGRFQDVIDANVRAAKADEDYIAQCRAQGMYPLAYYPHNLHFIWMGATATGQSKLAMESATKLASAIPNEALGTVPILQGFVVTPYWTMVRFEKWDEILADKGPRHDTPFTRGVWRYARAMALTAKEQMPEAERELEQLRAAVADPSLNAQVTFSNNTGSAILRIAPEVVAGLIAAKRKDWDKATVHLDRAIRYEDGLIYQEPHDWHAPVRNTLGNVLLAAGRADEAEAVFWEDLKKFPENGWSLLGLTNALKAQKKNEEAALIEKRFNKAWAKADFKRAVTTAAEDDPSRHEVTMGPRFVREFQISTVFKPVPEDFMNAVVRESLRLDASTWKGVIAGMTAYEAAEPQIKVPVLVIGGDKDAVFAVEEQHALVGSIQGARVRILPNIGHTPHWEDPDAFVTELLAFIGATRS